MTNAEKFQKVFGYYATEMWAKPEKEFLEWINEEALDQDKIIYCKDCKFKRGLGYEGHYYCALEDRPNRNWSVVETDFCSWAERQEPKRGEKAKTLFMNLYNCEKFVNLSNGVVCMKIPKCSIYDEIGREWIVNCVRQDNFECCFTHAFEQVERIEGAEQ